MSLSSQFEIDRTGLPTSAATWRRKKRKRVDARHTGHFDSERSAGFLFATNKSGDLRTGGSDGLLAIRPSLVRRKRMFPRCEPSTSIVRASPTSKSATSDFSSSGTSTESLVSLKHKDEVTE